MRIQHATLMSMNGKTYEDGFVDIQDGKILDSGDIKDAPRYSGDIYDAQGGYILPGLIDAHSHIGISEEGVRWEGEDCNEYSSAVTAQMRAEDGFYPFDSAIQKALSRGITTVVVSPGSTNVIGGQTAAIKLSGSNVRHMILKSPCSIKMAMGENPKKNFGLSGGKEPVTRMAIAAVLRRTLTMASRYLKQKAAGEDLYDPELEALLPLLRREIPAHIHAHRCDDILTALRIMEEFNIICHIIHATDARPVVEEIKHSGMIPILGPFCGPAGKPENAMYSFEVASILEKAEIEFAITTDHDVFPSWLLLEFCAIAVRHGLSEEAALRGITINAATVAGVADRIGSIERGKDADIVVFTSHPLHYLSTVRALFIDGKKII